jgi:hypothetical protein
MFLFIILTQGIKKKEEILDLDQHRFRKIVFHRDAFDVWVSAMSAPDFPGHTQAMTALDDAFKLGKGFLKFAYLDCIKNTYIPRRLNLTKQPYFCVFHAAGEDCRPGQDLSGRDVVNLASAFLPDFTETANAKWIRANEQHPAAILFTEREYTPVLWVAVATAFRGSQLKIAVSRDKEFAKALNVSQFPTILLHNLTHNIVYEGENEYITMKTNLKKFMLKRLLKVRSNLKVRPLAEFDNLCQGLDKICIVHAVSELAPELERLRVKHQTGLFEFFFGTGGEEVGDGAVVVNWPGKNRFIRVSNIEELEGVLSQILDGTAVWSEKAVILEEEGNDEDHEGL